MRSAPAGDENGGRDRTRPPNAGRRAAGRRNERLTYHSNRAPKRTDIGAWNEAVLLLPPLAAKP